MFLWAVESVLEGVESRGIAGVGLQGVLTRGGSRCRFHYDSEVWVSADCVGNAAVDIVPALSPSQSLAGCLSLSLLSFSLSLSLSGSFVPPFREEEEEASAYESKHVT